jgi:hypothetical protein
VVNDHVDYHDHHSWPAYHDHNSPARTRARHLGDALRHPINDQYGPYYHNILARARTASSTLASSRANRGPLEIKFREGTELLYQDTKAHTASDAVPIAASASTASSRRCSSGRSAAEQLRASAAVFGALP